MHNFHQYVIPICQTQNYCQKHYVYNAIDWNSTTYYTLETSIIHVEDPKYCFLKNIIHFQTPMKKEISLVLNNSYIDENQ